MKILKDLAGVTLLLRRIPCRKHMKLALAALFPRYLRIRFSRRTFFVQAIFWGHVRVA
jgi:hypothetical protein